MMRAEGQGPDAAGRRHRDQTQHQDAQSGWAVSQELRAERATLRSPPASPRMAESVSPEVSPFPPCGLPWVSFSPLGTAGWGPGQLDGTKGERKRRRKEGASGSGGGRHGV